MNATNANHPIATFGKAKAKRRPLVIARLMRKVILVARLRSCAVADAKLPRNRGTSQPRNYFLNNASNAFLASSGVCGWRGLSAERSFTIYGWKDAHSLRACLLAMRAGMV